MLPHHLVGECTDGTYRAYSLTDARREMDIYPMPDDLIPLPAPSPRATMPAAVPLERSSIR
jgi:hypothetical protein